MDATTKSEIIGVAEMLVPAEYRVLASLLLKLGMSGADAIKLMRQHGVTDEQIADADLENEVSTYERIKQLKTQ